MGSVISAFDEEQTQRLTGVTKAQLRYWDRTDFFSPTFNGERWDSTVGRIYSFRDVAALRVLNKLRNEHEVSLPHLREVGKKLASIGEEKWTGVKLYVQHNRRVAWDEPGTRKPQEVVSGQYVLAVEMDAVVSNLRRDIKALNSRPQGEVGRIEKSKSFDYNEAMIAGTRIKVRAIKRFRDAGYTAKQILKEYPDLTLQDVLAAMEYGETRAAA